MSTPEIEPWPHGGGTSGPAEGGAGDDITPEGSAAGVEPHSSDLAGPPPQSIFWPPAATPSPASSSAPSVLPGAPAGASTPSEEPSAPASPSPAAHREALVGFTGAVASAPGEATIRRPGRRPSIRLVGGVALAMAVAAGGAGWWYLSSRQPEPRRLSLALAGDAAQVFRTTARMRWVGESHLFGMEADTDFEGILTLKAVPSEQGGARLRGILDLSELTVNGRPFTEPPTVRSSMQIGRDGSLVRGGVFRLPRPSPPIQLSLTGLAPDLPTYPVRPGDTWSERQQIQLRKQDLVMTARSEFLRYEPMGLVEAAVIQGTKIYDVTGRGGRGKIRVEQTAWLDPDTGTVLRMTASIWIDYAAGRHAGFNGQIQAADSLELRAV